MYVGDGTEAGVAGALCGSVNAPPVLKVSVPACALQPHENTIVPLPVAGRFAGADAEPVLNETVPCKAGDAVAAGADVAPGDVGEVDGGDVGFDGFAGFDGVPGVVLEPPPPPPHAATVSAERTASASPSVER